jgi:Domain of unknown function (DUF4160)
MRWRNMFFSRTVSRSNEGEPREPRHVHVRKGAATAKFWLEPEVLVASSNGFDARTLRELTAQVRDHKLLIERTWDEHFR